jgi:beta-glucanase (GH16 family)
MVNIELTLLVIASLVAVSYGQRSVTTASGTRAPNGPYWPGQLIFEDNFDTLDFENWQHENTLAGGGNWEFQWYQNNRSNSFVEDGNLHIAPTLLADDAGEGFLRSGQLDVNGGDPGNECTNGQFWGCFRTGNNVNYLNPIKSARLRSFHSFAFKYGIVEVRAKMPSGDWLWPAIW